MKKVIVHSPASVANLVCGFDILGMALEEPFDWLSLEFCKDPGITIQHRDAFQLPEDPDQNVAGVVLKAMLKEADMQKGCLLTMEKRIMPGSGIGSSAASAAGIAVAANYLLGEIFSAKQLAAFAMLGEKLACGVAHADNIAPCILGGVSLIRSRDPLDIVKLSFPDLYVTIVHPQIEVRTSDARNILKQQVSLKDAIHQWGNIAGLVSGLLQKDYGLISRSLEDVIIEPIRSMLIPGFDEVKRKSKEVNALGGGIAGSGPSLFMLSSDQQTANKIEEVMKEIYDTLQIDYHTYVTTINHKGVQLVHSEE